MRIKKMNKNIVKNWTIFLILAVLLVLNSCSNFLSFEENKTAPQNEKCIITVFSDFSESEGLFSRAAFPNFVLPAETLYFAEISYTSDSSKKWLGEDSVCETAVVIKNNYSDEIRFVFCVPKETSSYTLTLYACPKQTESQISAVKNSAFAQGSTTFTLSAGQKSLSSSLNIELKPQETSGTGSVKLPLSFDSALGIVAAKVNVTKDGVSDSSGNNYEFEISVSESAAMLSAENVPAGTYLAIMKFYKSTTDFSSVNEVAVNFAVQQISVYSGMTSDCWFVDGKKIGTTGADGVFTPSALELTKYDFTELYVLGSDAASGEIDGKLVFYNEAHFGSSIPTITNVNGGDGSMTNPFATVQKAVDKIAAAGDTSKKYTIYVDGTVTADSSDDFKSDELDKTFIYIKSSNKLDLTIKGFSQDSKAVLDANQKDGSLNGNVLTVNASNANITLENLTITGGSRSATGGGIYAKGSLTLKKCTVTKNISNNAGGGISFSGKELVLENTSVTYNESSSNGGGINADGKVTISDSEILNNSAAANGGGIYFGDGEKTISGTTVNKNSAEFGGGIYMQNGTLNLESGAVIGEKLDPDDEENDISNVATSSDYGNRSTKQISSSSTEHDVGAGIFVGGGTVNMEDGAYICRNYTSCAGGGIFIKSGTFNMKGGTVGWNRSNYGGGIFCKGEINVSQNSKICYNKVSTLNAQGFCGRGGGIAVNENGIATISGGTKIFGNLAVRGENSSTNIDAMGAGIYCSAILAVEGGEIYDNSTESDGPAIAIENGTATLSGCKIYNNNAARYGGAIFVNRTATDKEATLDIKEEVQIYDNETNGQGGAIYIGSGTATISSCEIYKNTAIGDGGAIFVNTNSSAATAKLTIKENVLIKENHTDNNGGAIYATASVNESYVNIGEDENSKSIEITSNYAKRGGAFYGAANARFVMNSGKVFKNYSTKKEAGDGGGALFLWGGLSSYSTFLMNAGEISGNMAKNNGAGGAVYIAHGDGDEKSKFIMKGGLLSGNKATDENGIGSKLGGAIYLKAGGKIELSGSAVIDVEKDFNDIYLGISTESVQQKITITGTLAPGNNDAAGNQKYTARITPEEYAVEKEFFQSDSYTITSDDYEKFCVTGNDDSDEWFITTEGKLSKPTAISSLSSAPDFKLYPKLTVSTGDEMNKLSGFVNNGNTMAGTTVTLLNDITLGSDFQNIGNTDKPFSGTFDGNGKKIDSGTASLRAIFYQVTGGTIKNLTSSGKFSMSGIVAYLSDKGLIENCTNTATVTSDTYSPLGGVCAKMEDSIIDRCVNKGSVKLEKSGKSLSLALGGICGSATGVIKNSTNYDSVVYTETSSNDSCFVGGILGTTTVSADVDTELYNCINIGDVSGNEESASGIGGILGDAYILNCSVSMKNCVNMGNSSKNAIAGKCVGTSKDKARIDFTYYLEDSAPSVFAWSHDNAKAYSFKKRADLYMTTELVTVETLPSNDLIELLNAWVDKKNSSGAEQYLKWDIVDDRPSLVYE